MSNYFNTETTGEILTVHFTHAKILEETVIQQISAGLLALIDKSNEKNILLDFSTVGFMSSSALGALIKVNKKCKEFKINLKLCNIHADIMQVFKITRLDKVLAIYPDTESAYEAFKKTGGLFFRK
jgi:anti-sigma B factor antagonist